MSFGCGIPIVLCYMHGPYSCESLFQRKGESIVTGQHFEAGFDFMDQRLMAPSWIVSRGCRPGNTLCKQRERLCSEPALPCQIQSTPALGRMLSARVTHPADHLRVPSAGLVQGQNCTPHEHDNRFPGKIFANRIRRHTVQWKNADHEHEHVGMSDWYDTLDMQHQASRGVGTAPCIFLRPRRVGHSEALSLSHYANEIDRQSQDGARSTSYPRGFEIL